VEGAGLTPKQAWTAVCTTGRNPTPHDIKAFWEQKGLEGKIWKYAFEW